MLKDLKLSINYFIFRYAINELEKLVNYQIKCILNDNISNTTHYYGAANQNNFLLLLFSVILINCKKALGFACIQLLYFIVLCDSREFN